MTLLSTNSNYHLIWIIALLCLAWLTAFYFLIIKSKQDAKNKTKGPQPGRTNPPVSSTEPDEDKYWEDRYEQIIEDFPTHIRNN